MLLAIEKKLPAEITDALAMTKRIRCRIGWKMIATGYQSHGPWYDLSDEEVLKADVDSANRRHAGRMDHWIEYE